MLRHGGGKRWKKSKVASVDGDTNDPFYGCLGLLSNLPGLRKLSSSCGSRDDGSSTVATSFSNRNGVDES